MKSQVLKTKENFKWLDVILFVSVVLLMVGLISADKMVEAKFQNSDYGQRYIESYLNPIVNQDVLQSENSITIENELAVDNTLEMRIREYLQPEIEEPLTVEDWMLNENYWGTEPKTVEVAEKD